MRVLLDENCPRKLAEVPARAAPGLPVVRIQEWRDGCLMGRGDEDVLAAAFDDGLVLFTFDVTTIPAVLTELAVAGRLHAGVVFASCKRTPHSDYAAFAQALARLWQAEGTADWTNRVVFLSLGAAG